jgi:hypothetical protein
MEKIVWKKEIILKKIKNYKNKLNKLYPRMLKLFKKSFITDKILKRALLCSKKNKKNTKLIKIKINSNF